MDNIDSDLRDVLMKKSRLRALEQANILDTPNEAVYDGMTEKICSDLDVPVSLISIVDINRQFFKSQQGMPPAIVKSRETPLSHSICQNVVHQSATFAINDMRDYPVFFDHPALKDLNVVAYLGEPLIFDGEVIGSVCAIDHKPRQWNDEDIRKLKEQTKAVQDELNARKEKPEANKGVFRF